MTIAGVVVGVLIVVVVGRRPARRQGDRQARRTRASPTRPRSSTARPSATPDAPVTLEVYEDYQCPVCAQLLADVEPSLVSQYVTAGQLRIVHHDIAILGSGGANDESMHRGQAAPTAPTSRASTGTTPTGSTTTRTARTRAASRGARDADRRGGGRRGAGLLDAASTRGGADARRSTHRRRRPSASGSTRRPTMYIGGQQIVGLKSAAELGALIEAELRQGATRPPRRRASRVREHHAPDLGRRRAGRPRLRSACPLPPA